uniref:Ig-like domain-containing protein n=1 Tax=Chelydra serpentina TaxID=8475 RepID=A0A8C3T7T5_CHESE
MELSNAVATNICSVSSSTASSSLGTRPNVRRAASPPGVTLGRPFLGSPLLFCPGARNCRGRVWSRYCHLTPALPSELGGRRAAAVGQTPSSDGSAPPAAPQTLVNRPPLQILFESRPYNYNTGTFHIEKVDQWRGFPISPHFDGFSFILFLFPVKPTSPSVFPLVPCCTQTGNAPPDTSLACLVTGYFPAPVHIKWNSGQVTEEVKTFPEVTMSDGLLTQSSLLINPASSRQGNTYQCEVRHEGTAKPLTVLLPHPHPTQTPPIGGGRTKTIHHFRPKPSFVHTRTQSKPSAAQSTGSQPPGAPPAFSWLDGEVNKVLNVNVPQQGGVVASAVRTVELAVSLEGEWGSTKSDTGLCFPLSLLSVCGSTMPPQVHLLVPSCEDSSTESQLELVCLLLSFKLDKADVKWLVNGKERSPPTPAFSSAKGTDGFYMGQSRMNVTRESWEKGDIYTCQVTDPAVRKELSMRNTSKCLGEGLRP